MIDTHIELPDGAASINLLQEALEFSGVEEIIIIQRNPGLRAAQNLIQQIHQTDEPKCNIITGAATENKKLFKTQLEIDSRETSICGYVTDVHQQDIQRWTKNEDIHYSTKLIAEKGKPLDLIFAPHQAKFILPFLDAHPDLSIILDHCLSEAPTIDATWKRLLREIGRRPHVSYRLSSLAPMASAETVYETTQGCKEAFDAALEGFGTDRLIYGSGWPATPTRYPIWLNTIDNLIHTLSENERSNIYRENAVKIYNLTKNSFKNKPSLQTGH